MDGDDTELVAVLNDDYSRAILAEISREPMSAPELAESIDASKPTVYRRLSTLEELDLVATRGVPDDEGHHRTVYLKAVEAMHVQIDEEGINVSVDKAAADAVDRFTKLMGDLS